MQPQKTCSKTVLRYLQKKQPHFYLIPKSQKQQLGYPDQCLDDPNNPESLSQMISVDAQMILTQKGNQLCRMVIVNDKFEILYSKWFLTEQVVIDYLTNITGITKEVLQSNALKKYEEEDKKQIMDIIKGKIVVGHDLANDLQVLGIEHQAFIDTVHICPHNFGLPFKSKLKNLAMEILRKPIQWIHHDPTEDAIVTLEIAQRHISSGKGVMIEVPMKFKVPEEYKDVWKILQDAELDKTKIKGLFLRGSRALGLEMNIEGYKSDWDYVCIYDTQSQINGRLIKLTDIDITIFDINTFNFYIHDQNDISYLQLFFLPAECQIINDIKLPQINIQKLRQSLGFHLSKSKMKIQRFKSDDTKKWKILKAVHMKIRFMDNFVQIFDFGMIKDVKRMNFLWDEFKEDYLKSGKFQQTLKRCQTKANSYMQNVRQRYKSRRKVGRMELNIKHETKKQNVPEKNSSNKGNRNICNFQAIDHSSGLQMKSNPLHSKLNIVQQMREHGFNNLDQYKITMKRSVKYPNLIEFKYLQSASFKNPICHEARGIILDEDKNFEVVAYPYSKFFDYNDTKYSQVKDFDFRKYKIYQKFDGSISFIYFYDGEWQVASASVPDGQSGYCFARKETTTEFRKQFWRIFNELKYELPSAQDRNKTFVFELMSINHIIVCERETDNLVLHGVRNIDTLQEQDHQLYEKKYGWKVGKAIDLKLNNPLDPMAQIVQITNKLNPLRQEGYILCDWKYTRMKVKNADYLRIHWLGELNLTKNKDPSKYILINIVLAGEADTFSQYCPEWKPVIDEFCLKIQKLNTLVLQQYETVKNLQKKEFARQVMKKNRKIGHYLFQLRSNYDLYRGKIETAFMPKKFHQLLLQFQFN